MHEPTDTLVELDWHPSRSHLRRFGFAAALFCTVAGVGIAHAARLDRAAAITLREIFWSAAGLAAAIALLKPAWNRPLYVLVTCATFPIRWLFAWGSLVILFFLVLTPIAMAVRRLRTRLEPSSGSAWLPTHKRPEKARYFRQS